MFQFNHVLNRVVEDDYKITNLCKIKCHNHHHNYPHIYDNDDDPLTLALKKNVFNYEHFDLEKITACYFHSTPHLHDDTTMTNVETPLFVFFSKRFTNIAPYISNHTWSDMLNGFNGKWKRKSLQINMDPSSFQFRRTTFNAHS